MRLPMLEIKNQGGDKMKSMKRTIAMLLTLALVFASFPLGAFAEQELVAEQSSEAGGVSPAEPQTEVKQEAQEETPLEIGPEEDKQALQAPEENQEQAGEMAPLFLLPSYFMKGKHEFNTSMDQLGNYVKEGDAKETALRQKHLQMWLNVKITIKDEEGKYPVFESYHYIVDENGEEVKRENYSQQYQYDAKYATRYGGKWPVGTNLIITVEPSSIDPDNKFDETFHISYTSIDETNRDWILESKGPSIKIKHQKDKGSYWDAKGLRIRFGYMTVEFRPYGGNFGGETTSITTVVKRDNTVTFPDDPTRNGYMFEGWFTRTGDSLSDKRMPLMWSKDRLYSHYDSIWAYNPWAVDPWGDYNLVLRALWRRPRLTFYYNEKKDIDESRKNQYRILPVYSVYFGKSLKETDWEGSQVEDSGQAPINVENINTKENKIFMGENPSLPTLESQYLPKGKSFDKWIFYDQRGEEQEFKLTTQINGDMEIYPKFKEPALTSLTFYKSPQMKDDEVLDKPYHVAYRMSLQKSFNEKVYETNPDVDKIEKLPEFGGTVPEGMLFSHWAYKNEEGKEAAFTNETIIRGDTKVYPVFRKPRLTFYVIEKPEEGGNPKYLIQRDMDVAKGSSLKGEGMELPELNPSVNNCKEFSHWVYYDENGDPQKFTEDMQISGDMQLYAAFKGEPVPPTPPTPPTPKPNDPSGPSGPSDPSNPTKPSTPDKPSTDQPSPNVPSKPGTDSGIKTPSGSPLTSSEIAKILAGTKKTVPYIPRAGVGK